MKSPFDGLISHICNFQVCICVDTASNISNVWLMCCWWLRRYNSVPLLPNPLHSVRLIVDSPLGISTSNWKWPQWSWKHKNVLHFVKHFLFSLIIGQWLVTFWMVHCGLFSLHLGTLHCVLLCMQGTYNMPFELIDQKHCGLFVVTLPKIVCLSCFFQKIYSLKTS